jgi:hypothetical protein
MDRTQAKLVLALYPSNPNYKPNHFRVRLFRCKIFYVGKCFRSKIFSRKMSYVLLFGNMPENELENGLQK